METLWLIVLCGETLKGPAKAPGSSRKLPAAKPLESPGKKPLPTTSWPVAKSLNDSSASEPPITIGDATPASTGNRAIPDYDKFRSAAKPEATNGHSPWILVINRLLRPLANNRSPSLPAASKAPAKLP